MSSSDTGGVKAMSLQGRLYRERERLAGMTEEERCFRSKWVSDQKLCPSEPQPVKELYTELYNPIRRFYRFPLDTFQSAVSGLIGKQAAPILRYSISSTLMIITFVYAGAYYFKYNANDWTRKGGWRVLGSRPLLYSNEPGFPSKYDREKPSDYASRGFKNSPI